LCKKRHTPTIQFAAGEQKAHVKQQVKVKSIMGREINQNTPHAAEAAAAKVLAKVDLSHSHRAL
jgi:hypothetical protein